MKKIWWFCPLFTLGSCLPQPAPGKWDGKYIGYYHQNQKDTVLVQMIFSGKFFAASPHYATDGKGVEGVFEQQQSALIFHHVDNATSALLQGPYQYQFNGDGTIRLWQETDADFREIILRHQ